MFETPYSIFGKYFGYGDSFEYVFHGIPILLSIISVHVSCTLLAVPTGERYYMHNPSSSPCCFLSGGERGGGHPFSILALWISKCWGSFWLREYGRAVPSSSSPSIVLFSDGVGVLAGTPGECFCNPIYYLGYFTSDPCHGGGDLSLLPLQPFLCDPLARAHFFSYQMYQHHGSPPAP